ncbi:efflux RND transporter periplasmic adaptor subunit [Gemmobacter denitrificans]|uniref:Efflux RND transporter periplasmic adaptor subunit n=1 Tax=Gemmobacter denitrificans TaxID=3123040 RepID=A0ABU8C0I0_9RHOB
MIRPLIPAGLVLLALAAPLQAQIKPEPPRPVVSQIVQPEAGLGRMLTGTVMARTQISLGFQTFGRIAERPVTVGDVVSKGQILARLDPYTLDEDIAAAEAALTTARAQQVTATNALTRARELQARGVASTARLEEAERMLAAADAAVDSAVADLARATDARGYSDLVAPEDGVILSTAAEAGAVVSAGNPVVVLASTSEIEAVIDLPEELAGLLSIGDRFVVSLRAGATAPVTGELRLVEPVVDATSRTRRVHLTLIAPPPGYRIGSLVQARLSETDPAPLFTLPRNAIRHDGAATAVWRVDPTTRAVALVPVTLDPQGRGPRAAITDGLQPGDEIVTRGVNSLIEGQIVGMREAE